MKKRNVLLILLLLLLSGSPVFSATQVGTMVLKNGMVKLRRAGADTIHKEVGKEISLSNLDEIQTGALSHVTIHLTAKGDNIELFSQSFFKIDNVDKDTSGVSMSIGKAKFTIPKGKRPLKRGKRRFRVKTANALVGVKGTEFVLATGAEETNLLTLEGSVTMASVTAPDVEVEVQENQVSQIRQDAPPTNPVTVTPSVRDNILNTDSPKAFQAVQFGTTVSGAEEKKDSQKKEEKKEAQSKEEQKQDAPKEEPKSSSTTSGGTTSAPASSTGGTDEEGQEAADPAASESQSDSEGALSEESDDGFIDLENLDEEDLADTELDWEFEEPEIDIDIDEIVDGIIEVVTETTAEVEEQIEEAEESIESAQQVEITITYQ